MKRILITGHRGFLGKNLCKFYGKRKEDYFLYTPYGKIGIDDWSLHIPDDLDYIFHFADVGGTLEFVKNNSEKIISENSYLHANLLYEWKTRWPMAKLIIPWTAWAYPDHLEILTECNLCSKNVTNLYGIEKHRLFNNVMALREEGLFATFITLGNVFGPGDNYSYDKIHLIPSLIKQYYDERKSEKITVHNDGNNFRSFIYIDDQIEILDRLKDDYGIIIQGCSRHDIYSVEQIATRLISLFNNKRWISYDTTKHASNRIILNSSRHYDDIVSNVKRFPIQFALESAIEDYENFISRK